MTYHHKRDSCSKETREILENIFRDDLSSYELPERKVKTSSAEKSPSQTDRENVLPAEAAVLLSDSSIPAANDESSAVSSVTMERYIPPQEPVFEASEAKESYEKKKKHRNYVEFSPDYEKI